MIQRIQTVYFLLAIILLTTMLFIPLASFQMPTGEIIDLHILGNNQSGITLPILISSIISSVLCFIAIFLYQSRKRQVVVAYIALLPIILLCGYFIGYCLGLTSSEDKLTLISIKGIILPVISFILIFLAIRKIKADEKLVRSLDRIR